MKEGTRNFYVIAKATNWDGCDCDVMLITSNHKEAIARFKWLYDVGVYNDFLNEDGDPTFDDRNINIRTNDKDKKNIQVNGNFWYCDSEGSCSYILTTIKTNYFYHYGNPLAYWEQRYRDTI